jgi:citrate synthase
MVTVMFAIGRLSGLMAQWKESQDDPNWKLCRPRQIYNGPAETEYVPLDKR